VEKLTKKILNQENAIAIAIKVEIKIKNEIEIENFKIKPKRLTPISIEK